MGVGLGAGVAMGQTMMAAMKHTSEEEEDAVPVAVAGKKRFCVDCGQAIPDGARYCPSCGREQ
jgi:membrane protease subunit (stomatin/prohibitin family)